MTGYADATAYILAGGFGTRLRQVVFDRPKALAEILGRPYLFHLLDRLADAGLRRVVLCTGHMAGQLEEAVGGTYRDMAVLFSREETPLGTGGALRLAFERYPSPLALALNGDSLTDADLGAFLGRHGDSGAAASLLLVPVDDAERYGRVETGPSGRVTGFTEKGQGGPGWISAGVYLLRPEVLASITPGVAASIERDVFPALAAGGGLYGHKARARFLDIGTPESYASAARFLLGGADLSGNAAVFLDRDGTVITEKHYLHDPAGVELAPGAAEGLRSMRDLGLPLVLVSNQSGVGRGFFPRADVERVHGRLIELLRAEGVELAAIYICPHAPGDECRCRKPLPGMLERAVRELGVDPLRSFMIGDKPCDVDLGLIVGATTLLVTTGYGAAHAQSDECRPHHVVHGLDEAARIIKSIVTSRRATGQESA